MKKKLITIAREMDFSTTDDYFDYLITCHTNGNFSQCRSLFDEMRKEDQKELIEYCDFLPKVRKFYFDLL